jgi:hypothetical protein
MPICSVDRFGLVGMSSVPFGGARLPNDLTIEPKPLMISVNGADTPKNVPSRDRALGHGSARLRRIDIISKEPPASLVLHQRRSGAWPHQKKRNPTTDERELIPTVFHLRHLHLDVICTSACLNIRT